MGSFLESFLESMPKSSKRKKGSTGWVIESKLHLKNTDTVMIPFESTAEDVSV